MHFTAYLAVPYHGPMRNPLALLVLCVCAGVSGGQTVEAPAAPAAGESVSDFGFWPGEWLVLNTRYDAEHDVYVDAGASRSVAESLLGGRLLLERWAGESGAVEALSGLTLRYFAADRGRWVTITNWPAGTPMAAQFTRTEGSFEDGLIVLHPSRVYGPQFESAQFLSTRSVVSDVASDSFRVQLQRPVLAQTWAASWAMDYVRQGPAEDGPLVIEAVPETPASDAAEPRLTDWMIGSWSGDGVNLRVSSALGGLGFVASVEVDRMPVEASAVLVGAWDAVTGTWQIREVGLHEPLRSLAWEVVGRVRSSGMVLRSKGIDDSGGMVFRRLDDGGMQFELTLPEGGRLDVELEEL